MKISSCKAMKQLKALSKYGKNLKLPGEVFDKPWKSLISTMLSARTRDETTIKVSINLYKKYPTIKKLSRAKEKDIKKIIKPVNYYKTKAKNVLSCSKILAKQYNGKPPSDFEKLIKLPGVGRKTANVYLSEQGYDAIGVDTHVFQLTRKLGWTKNTKHEKIEEDLKKLFPKKKWKNINTILVRFGRSFRGKKQEKILKDIKKL